MQKYQILYIIDKDVADEAKDQLVEKINELIASLGGTVSTVDKWGLRKYAYPIKFKDEGYYVLVLFEAPPAAIKELDRQMRINVNIVRQLITKK